MKKVKFIQDVPKLVGRHIAAFFVFALLFMALPAQVLASTAKVAGVNGLEQNEGKRKITGVVKDSYGDPLPGASVMEEGTSNGTITNFDGEFSLTVQPNAKLFISFMGFVDGHIAVSTKDNYSITLAEDVEMIDEVVVVGYGTMKKSHLSGAVSSVGNKELQSDVATNIAGALQGKIAGVAVTSSGGQPGGGFNINIRGLSSLSGNDPLYVIDGAFGSMSLVDPSDIESIEVLKDASAAAIYGSRAANGVVLVTTKSGKKDTPTKVDASFFLGIKNVPNKIKVLNGNEYSRFARYYHLPADGYGYNESETEFMGKGTNWQDQIFHTAQTYKANVGISGGSKTGTYSVSMGYLNEDGVIRTTGHESYNIRSKTDFSFFNNKFRLGQTLIAKVSKDEGSVHSATIFDALQSPPVIPVYDDSRVGGYATSNDINLANPYGELNLINNTNRNNSLFFNGYAEVELIKGLTYKLNFAYDLSNARGRRYVNAYDMGLYGTNEKPDLTESTARGNMWLLEQTINYQRTFAKHDINLLSGYSAQDNSSRTFSAAKNDIGENIGSLGGATDKENTRIDGGVSRNRLISYFARLMYSYDSRYLFSASIRRDASSKFHSGYRSGYFPSVSAGWNIHSEKFAEPITKYVSQMRLRASYGVLGNNNVGNYATQSTVNTGMDYIQGSNTWLGSAPNTAWISPRNLTWETTKTTNIGLDLGFFDQKLTLTADYFDKKTSDVLLYVNMPSSSGMNGAPQVNAGVIGNKGFEMAINYQDKIADFDYYIGANVATLSNKVKSIKVGDPNMKIRGFNANGHGGQGITMLERGHEMVYFNLIESDGIFRSQEEILAHVDKHGNLIQPDAQVGDVRYIDYNGDGRITEDDQHDMGSPFPDFTFGIRMGGEWKNFDLALFFDGSVGNDVYNYPKFRLESGNFSGNYGYKIADSWRPDNQNTSVPRFSKIDGQLNKIGYSDRWLESGSYLRLKTIELGYTLPKSLVKKAYLDRVRVYAMAENLFTFTGYSGYTPDVGASSITDANGYYVLSTGVDQGRYPIPRTFSFGIQVGF